METSFVCQTTFNRSWACLLACSLALHFLNSLSLSFFTKEGAFKLSLSSSYINRRDSSYPSFSRSLLDTAEQTYLAFHVVDVVIFVFFYLFCLIRELFCVSRFVLSFGLIHISIICSWNWSNCRALKLYFVSSNFVRSFLKNNGQSWHLFA